MKDRLVAELFIADGRTDGQTDMAKLIVTFRNSANAPNTLRIVPALRGFVLRKILTKTAVCKGNTLCSLRGKNHISVCHAG
jgi:hypothetical protein